MNKIREVQRLNQRELETCTPPSASWHNDYRHTAFIYVGGLPFNVSEGDIITIFSQYGQPVYLNLVRDKETGKSKGFAFLKYEDQRSCDLAVDNLTGAEVLGRILSVDHCDYKVKDGERIYDNTGGEPEGDGVESDDESEEESRPELPEERELQRILQTYEHDDPMKAVVVKEKKQEAEEALARWRRHESRRKSKSSHREHHRSSKRGHRLRDRSEQHEDKHKHRHRTRTRSPAPSIGEENGTKRRRRSSTPSSPAEEKTGRRFRRDRRTPPASDDDHGRGSTREYTRDNIQGRRRSRSHDRYHERYKRR